MWVIRDKDSTIYLIGTLHLLRHEMEWNAAKVKKTVTESTRALAGSGRHRRSGEHRANHRAVRHGPGENALEQAERRPEGKAGQGRGDLQRSLASLEPMQPWLAAVMFAVLPLQKAGYDPNAGVDRLLKAQAEKEGDKVHGFETAEEQVRFFADLPEAEQVAFLDEVARRRREGNGPTRKTSQGLDRMVTTRRSAKFW